MRALRSLGVLTWAAFAVTKLHTQELPVAKNAAYVEALGSGLAYSLNYERQVTTQLALRVGAGGLGASDVTYVLGFGGVTWRPRPARHSVILGLNLGVVWLKDVWFLEGNEEVNGYAVATLGYRFQPTPRGLLLQAAFTPVVTAQEVAAWGGVAVGVAF